MALTEIDRRLLKRCLVNEPGAWKDFVDRFMGLFVHVVNHTAYARSVRLSLEDIDDLTADVFLALMKDDFVVLRNFRGKSSLATYLTVIARRVVVKEISRRRMSEAMGHVTARGSAFVQQGATGDTQIRIDNSETVQRMLENLSDQESQVVKMFHLEGRSYTEISDTVGMPVNSIGPTLTRVRERLKRDHVEQ